ncbi:hypothetical protein Tco_1560646, partial [Tanacetum coccineum]
MSMLVKDTRSQDGIDDKDNDKGSNSRSQSMKEQDYNEDKDQEHLSLNDKSNLTDLMKEYNMLESIYKNEQVDDKGEEGLVKQDDMLVMEENISGVKLDEQRAAQVEDV